MSEDGDDGADRDVTASPGGDESDPLAGVGEADVDDPFAELDDVDGEPLDGDVFTEVEFEEIDEAAVWEELTKAEPTGEPAEPATEVSPEDEIGEAVVAKSRYCEQCPHVSDPPAIECTRPGTEIRELVDNDSFRVYNCPIVERRRGSTRAVSFEIDPD